MSSTVFRLLNYFSFIYIIQARVCYIGNQPDDSGQMKWVLPKDRVCECTVISLGGYSTSPINEDEFHVVKQPFISNDKSAVRTFLKKEGLLPTVSTPPPCPTNMIFSECTAQSTCQHPNDSYTDCNKGECNKSCICPNGFLMNGSDCVRPEECGCYIAEIAGVIPEGEIFISEDYTTQCVCIINGTTLNCYNANQCHEKKTGLLSTASSSTTPPPCPTNMMFSECTAQYPIFSYTDCNEGECNKSCICPNGFLMNGSDCVRHEVCGCYITEIASVIPEGEVFISEDCTTQCVCIIEGTTLDCYNANQCHENKTGRRYYRRARACEYHNLHLTCPSGQKLRIIEAAYGRNAGEEICPHESISQVSVCLSPNSREVVVNACDGQHSCTVSATNGVFGYPDPCPGIYKYLEVKYTCGC